MAYEIKDSLQALGTFAGENPPLGGNAVLNQSGFLSFERTGVGVYVLKLQEELAPLAGLVAGVPKAGARAFFSCVSTGPTVVARAFDPQSGLPIDCALFDLFVLREPNAVPNPAAALPVVPDPAASLNLYVRAGGSDSASGAIDQPLATPRGASARIPLISTVPTTIHVGAGSYDFFGLSDKVWLSDVAIVGDGGGDPADDGFTEVLASTAISAAGANPTGTIITTGAFVVDEFRSRTIEFLTGANAGAKNTVRSNTATDFEMGRALDNPVVAGDTFRIVRANVFLTQPLDQEIMLASNCGTAEPQSFQITPSASAVCLFVNVRYTDGTFGLGASFGTSRVWAWGLELGGQSAFTTRLNVNPGSSFRTGFFNTNASPEGPTQKVQALLGAFAPANLTQWNGWGLQSETPQAGVLVVSTGAVFEGVMVDNDVSSAGSSRLRGGRLAGSGFATDNGGLFLLGQAAAPLVLDDGILARGAGAFVTNIGAIQVSSSGFFGSAVVVQQGAVVNLQGSPTSADLVFDVAAGEFAFDIHDGGDIYLANGLPTITGAGDELTLNGAAAFPGGLAAALPASGDSQRSGPAADGVGNNGAGVIQRNG